MALAVSSLSAAVIITKSQDHLHIEIDGKPFTDFYYGPGAAKPYLHPLRSASGKIVTRRFPMENVPGESTTDQHHRGVWLGFKQVNGFNFWENEFSYHDKNAGKVVTRGVEIVSSGKESGSLRGTFDWLSPTGEAMLEENRTMSFKADNALRMIDIDLTLKALVDATFGDSKDGAFSIRLAEPLTEKNSGTITNSAGGRKMEQTWGKQANWVDYSGELDGEKLGIALFDHPASFHHPARWHVRDYGLLAVNPFGSNAFDKQAPDATFTLPRGQEIRLRYRIVIHPALDSAQIERLYQEFANSR
jgi:Methane oxygenase PmoA